MIHQSIHSCEWFVNSLSEIGEKGYSVIALKDGEHRSFYVEARPFEREVVEWPAARDQRGNILPYALSILVPIKFCPACGADLSRAIAANTDGFDALVEAVRARHPGNLIP